MESERVGVALRDRIDERGCDGTLFVDPFMLFVVRDPPSEADDSIRTRVEVGRPTARDGKAPDANTVDFGIARGVVVGPGRRVECACRERLDRETGAVGKARREQASRGLRAAGDLDAVARTYNCELHDAAAAVVSAAVTASTNAGPVCAMSKPRTRREPASTS